MHSRIIFLYRSAYLSVTLILHGFDVSRFQTFFALLDIERYPLPFSQSFESFSLNSTEMNKNIATIILFDETETLAFVEPLHFTFWHSLILLS